MIGIIDYGMSNIRSVKNALDFLSLDSKVVIDPRELKKLDKVILPGVGAFGNAINNLESSGFKEAITEFALSKKPFLGICLGMQLLFEKSYEHGEHKGLNLIKGEVLPLKTQVSEKVVVPHMGWHNVSFQKQDHQILKSVPDQSDFYFVHSYFCKASNPNDILGTINYGLDFHVAIAHENIFGFQFHPEKSQKIGLQILKNFGEYKC